MPSNRAHSPSSLFFAPLLSDPHGRVAGRAGEARARRARPTGAPVENHLKRHAGDPEKSLAALDLNRSTRESLARTARTGRTTDRCSTDGWFPAAAPS